MNKDKIINYLKTEYDLITPYILNDLSPFEWQPIKFVSDIEPIGNHFRIINDENLDIYEVNDRWMETEYLYTYLMQVGWNSSRKQKALIKLKDNHFLLIEFK